MASEPNPRRVVATRIAIRSRHSATPYVDAFLARRSQAKGRTHGLAEKEEVAGLIAPEMMSETPSTLLFDEVARAYGACRACVLQAPAQIRLSRTKCRIAPRNKSSASKT
ncbi:hypothetical protein [Bradyrhizobium sp. NP1]|uniref:hypothetical protein n=1 Tax=Bradyrhizobium sp. NP1 TaxID=3049772 RepID=UPI0025A536ED|nr:hypothetical protein [Bradyrhizobium sp. NP1]WJR76875.1 hypothetical protein QOU61_29605 [Bradyrhizobium sp. NP1]